MQVDYIHEKGTGKINEDALLLEDHTFGVFDGATSLSNFETKSGKTGGYLASNITSNIFKQHPLPLNKRAKIANTAIAEKMRSYQVNTAHKHNLWSTSAAAIKLEDDHLEWLQTGDSDIILIFKDGSYQVMVETPNHDYETLNHWKNICNRENESIFKALKDQIIAVRNKMNITYGVLNGEDAALNLMKFGSHSIEKVRDILLFTDGLKIPSTEISYQNNYDELVNVYLSSGLKGLRDYVRELEKTDPTCRQFPRFKQHDDIAAISISL